MVFRALKSNFQANEAISHLTSLAFVEMRFSFSQKLSEHGHALPYI